MLKNFWYAIEESAAIKQAPKLVKVLGQELVIYRTAAGRAVVMSNLCIHRGGALSGGWVDGECIRCPYHGWKFAPDGACVEIPANQEGMPIPKKAHVDAYPTEERYGWIWAFLGDLPESERPPIPPLPEFGQPGWRAIYGEFTWQAHYSRVVENGIDIAHTPFVHANSFGDRERPQIADYTVESDDYSANCTVTLTSPRPKGLWRYVRKGDKKVVASLAVYMPNITRLHLRLDNDWQTIVVDSNIPIDEKTTLTRFIALRNFFTGSWADRDAHRRMMKIFREDQATVESQRPELLPYDLGAELHLKSDAMAVAFRKLRKKHLDRGWGIDVDTIRSNMTGRHAVVIPSPARVSVPELAKAWVFPEVPLIPPSALKRTDSSRAPS